MSKHVLYERTTNDERTRFVQEAHKFNPMRTKDMKTLSDWLGAFCKIGAIWSLKLLTKNIIFILDLCYTIVTFFVKLYIENKAMLFISHS